MKITAIAGILIFCLCGCSDIPIKNGELVMGNNTTATMDDVGMARVKNQF